MVSIIPIEEEDNMGLWHQAMWLHQFGMVGNPRSDLQLLFSVTSFGLLQVCVYLILVTLSSNDFNKLDIDSLSVYVYIDT